MLLEVVATREVDLALADTWLLRLPAVSMVGGSAGTYLRHMSQCVLQLQSAGPGQDLSPWRLSVLESCPTGRGAQLVPVAPPC